MMTSEFGLPRLNSSPQTFKLGQHHTEELLDAWAPRETDVATWDLRMQGISPFVVEDGDGNIVAYAVLQMSGYIDHFFVSPAVGRTGVGSLLMRHIQETASARGTNSLFADVSLTARPFFEKCGFAIEAVQSVSIREVTLDNFRMRKILQTDS
jgi:putative acetyltransferase